MEKGEALVAGDVDADAADRVHEPQDPHEDGAGHGGVLAERLDRARWLSATPAS